MKSARYILKSKVINIEHDLIRIQFEKTGVKLKLEKSSIKSYYFGKKIKPGTTLIIFDEIQFCNKALTSLKYFCEQVLKYQYYPEI